MRWTILAVFSLASLVQGADIALTVDGVRGRDGAAKPALELRLGDLAAMPRTTVQLTSEGKPHTVEGVLVYEVLKKAGQPFGDQMRKEQLMKYAVFSAHDGYRALFALPEFDPAFTTASALIVDRMDGQPLPAGKGPLRLVIPGEKTGSRSIFMLERIDVQSAPPPMR
ncbi:MAG: molybdopterin-dependent oxidoreductase [Candidatus Solibacter sp.]|jgi:DMSO/TMAO reductase YedYZ molybdopterin-dependent catalytic subunit